MGPLSANPASGSPFETRADEYDSWFETHSHLFQQQQEFIRPFIRENEGLILEIGCGSGRFAAALGIPVGIEPSGPLGRMACQRGVATIQGVGEYLPVRSRSISQVFLITVLGFVTSPAGVLREIGRSLLLSGSLIIVDIDMESETGERYQREQPSSTFLSQARLYSPRQILFLLDEAGFIVSDFQQSAGLLLISGSIRK